jgi:very-short-patch-repair endonuclease
MGEDCIVILYQTTRDSMREVARILNIPYSRVRQTLIRRNVPIRSRSEVLKGHPPSRPALFKTEEHKKKISLALKGKAPKCCGWNKGKLAPWVRKRNLENNPVKSPLVRRKISESVKRLIQERGHPRGKLGKPDPKARQRCLIRNKLVPRAFTKLENVFDSALKELGFVEGKDYIRQKVFLNTFLIDFYFPTKRVALEVDGAYYHSLRKDTDEKRDRILEGCGITVIRINDKEMKEYDTGEAKKILLEHLPPLGS